MTLQELESLLDQEMDMAKQKRNIVRVPLALSPEQYEALQEHWESMPGLVKQRWLRDALGELYKKESGKPWPEDPIWGDQSKKSQT